MDGGTPSEGTSSFLSAIIVAVTERLLLNVRRTSIILSVTAWASNVCPIGSSGEGSRVD